jgi:hypothetical protein
VPAVRPPEDSLAADLLTQLRWVVSQLEAETRPGRPGRSPAAPAARARASGAIPGPNRALAPGVATASRDYSGRTRRRAMIVIFWLGSQIHGVLVTASCRLHRRRPGDRREARPPDRRRS